MSPVYRIDGERNLVSLYWKDFPSMPQLRDVVEDAIANPEFRRGMNFLWDRRPGDSSSATVDYLREALYYLRLLAERIGPHAWAIVAHNPPDFGKARMLETMSDQTQVTIRAFQSCGDAEEWLRNPVRYEPIVVHFPARSPSLMHPGLA
ncbi:MAG TPA: hypothetical protein VJ825_11560 [Gemmatimonadaceae bacterium]|nr:hypothetical protein [Gemmatimonadaceae bacterium]